MNRLPVPHGLVAAAALATLLAGCGGSPAAATGANAAACSAGASALTVSVTAPVRESWPQTIRASGPVAAWQEVIVSNETGGLRLADLRVDVGAQVRRGQVLARLADESLADDVRKQEATVQQAEVALQQAASDTRRAKLVESSGALSAQKIESYRLTEASDQAALASAKADLESARLKLRQATILAPDDGVVVSKSAVLGNVVSAGTELFRLVRQGKVEWRPELDARQLAQAGAGQVARVTLPSGQVVEGRVRLVGPALSTSTGRATVYVSLPAASAARVGMFAGGEIDLAQQDAVTLPATALVQRDGRTYVYSVDAGNKVHAVPVTTGRRQGTRVELLAGADGLGRVVAAGGAFLSEGVAVTVVDAAAPSKGA